jgi:hypothetical protein
MPFPHICSLGFGKPLFFLRFILTVLFEKESSILVFFSLYFTKKTKIETQKTNLVLVDFLFLNQLNANLKA